MVYGGGGSPKVVAIGSTVEVLSCLYERSVYHNVTVARTLPMTRPTRVHIPDVCVQKLSLFDDEDIVLACYKDVSY